jgi:hypothetical protein
MFGIKPTPMPCMKRTGSRVFDVCGRSQYDSCLAGDCLRLVTSTAGRGGKISMLVARVQWKSKPSHSIRICVIVSTIIISYLSVSLNTLYQIRKNVVQTYEIPQQAPTLHCSWI